MRTISGVWLSGLLFAACSTQPLPEFQFRRFTQKVSLAQARAEKLVDKCETVADETLCEPVGENFAGAYALVKRVTFKDGVFQSLSFNFATADFGTVTDTLKAAYGEPCGAEKGQLNTDYGRIEGVNDRLYWCFLGGKLVAEEYTYGARSDQSIVEYPALPRDGLPIATPGTL